MTGIHLPLFDQIAEQVAVVVDTARRDELQKWVDWLASKRDKAAADAESESLNPAARRASEARATAFEAARWELDAARIKIDHALKGEPE